jgi:hypothetical protein
MGSMGGGGDGDGEKRVEAGAGSESRMVTEGADTSRNRLLRGRLEGAAEAMAGFIDTAELVGLRCSWRWAVVTM